MENGPFIDGLPINSMVIFHGYVSHNQMLWYILWDEAPQQSENRWSNPNMLMVDQFPDGNGPLFRETRFQTQWEFQDPKMKVLYHIVGHILWDIPLHRPEK